MQHLSKDFDSFGSTLLSEIAGTVAGSCGQIERAEIGLRYTENLAEIVRTSLPTADMSRQILQSTLRE